MSTAKSWFILLSVIVIALLIVAFKPGKDSGREQPQKAAESFAVIELFTSEGCSSCPPADELLGEIAEKARAGSQRIFALAFHVDYWNDLGWKDIYSRAEFSRRQRNYARALHSNSVYTPQMIVNGKTGFVGSNSSKARSSIQTALDTPAAVSIYLNKVQVSSNSEVKVEYELDGVPAGALLNVAVVERGISRNIKRGENRGLRLQHENVVRSFKTVDAGKARGTATLDLPADVDISKASVIAYVQQKDSWEVIGAEDKKIQPHRGGVKPG